MERFINHLKRNNYSVNTISTYRSILSKYQDDFSDIRSLKSAILKSSNNPNTINTHYSVVHSYLTFSKDKRIEKLKQIKLPHKPLIYREVFTKEFLEKRTTLETEQCLLIRFLFETGLRAAELHSILEFNDQTLLVKGKGNKIREVFHNIDTTSRIKNFNISTRTLRRWVHNVLGDKFSPHSIRRSHATHLLTNGANPKMVMMQLGHSSIETTFRYLQLSKDANRNIYIDAF